MNEIIDYENAELAVTRMNRDVKLAAATLGPRQARFLVDSYYLIQDQRIRTGNQVRQISESSEPVGVLVWANSQFKTIEDQVKAALDVYSKSNRVGKWMREQKGIGPVLASGFLAHIDIEKAPTAGHIWAFAGLDPTKSWGKGEKRPWNAQLKKICFLAGESFVKTSGVRAGYYGTVFAQRKAWEIKQNIEGSYAEYAEKTRNEKKFSTTTDAYKWYNGIWNQDRRLRGTALDFGMPDDHPSLEDDVPFPMLPPAHIHARARRYAVKLFLSHLHEVWYEDHFGEKPPKPYAIEHLGHAHYLAPPRDNHER